MIEIRPLNKSDKFEGLISLSREFFSEYEAYHKDFFKIDHLKDEDVISYFSSFRDQPKRKAFIALDGERIIGYITVYVKRQADYWKIKEVGEISGLMVNKGYRRGGVASKLLAQARDFFEMEEIRYFLVYTAVNNQEAIDFYNSNGLLPLYTTMMGEIDHIPN